MPRCPSSLKLCHYLFGMGDMRDGSVRPIFRCRFRLPVTYCHQHILQHDASEEAACVNIEED